MPADRSAVAIRRIDANTSVKNQQHFTFNNTTAAANKIGYLASETNEVIFYGDVIGAPTADSASLIKNITSLSASDFPL